MISSETVPVTLVITLFGPMQIKVQGRPLPRLRSRKTLWLLALLALRHNRPVEREWLAGTLWPDREQSQAYAAMRPVLSELRNALGSEARHLKSPNRSTLLLELTDVGIEVDVQLFDTAIQSGNPAALEQAIALYRGPLLEGCSEEWVAQERNVREQNCFQALQMLASRAMEAEDYDVAVRYYQRAMDLDAWSDAVRRGLMEAFARSGDRNAALQVYREFVNHLKCDPKAVPDESTTLLYQRLREEIQQQGNRQTVSAPKAQVAPLVAGDRPYPRTELVGREEERIEVAARLRRSRLVTLTGFGGIGKTRLAFEVAADCAGAYADGVWFVALESLTEGNLVIQQIASTLGLREQPDRPLRQSVAEHLSHKRCLLVMDNCEHLVQASAAVATHLLSECPELRLLATSREPLGIIGETAWSVPSLSIPEKAHLPQELTSFVRVVAGYDSVQLFVERAQAVQKTFALTEENALAIAEICVRLEGIPLALELAAARVNTLTIEQIATCLNDELSLLIGENRTALPRQQTLRAALDWSCALLTESERLLLGRLSVFAGGWTLEAAEGVGSGAGIEVWQVLDLLTSLVDKSLITFETPEEETGGRYRLLEMVRQYATENLLTSGERKQMKSRHRDWFLVLAEEAEPQLLGANQKYWLRCVDREYENLREALVWCAAEGSAAQEGLRMAGALWRYWSVRGHNSEGRRFLEWALTKEEASVPTQIRAKALYGAGALAVDQSDYVSAQSLLEESLGISRQLEDKSGIALATSSLGDIARNQGDLTAAKTQTVASLQLHRELDNKSGIASMLIKLGEIAYNQGELAAANTHFEESLRLYRELGNKLGMSNVLFVLGNAATMQSDYVRARSQFEESLLLRKELGHKYGIAQVLSNLANASSLQGDYAAAQAQREESLRLEREMGNKRGVAYMLINLGADAAMQGDYVRARTQLEESLLLCRESRNKYGSAAALINLGDVVTHQGDYTTARRQLEEGLSLCRELGDKQVSVYALSYLSRVVALQGDIVTARTQFEEGLRLCRELGDKRGIALTLENFAVVLSAQTDSVQAARLLGAAQALRKSIRTPLPPSQQELVDRQIAQVHTVLGTAAFSEAWEEGSAMTSEQIIRYTLKE